MIIPATLASLARLRLWTVFSSGEPALEISNVKWKIMGMSNVLSITSFALLMQKQDDDNDAYLFLLDSEASGEVEACVGGVWIFQATRFSRIDSSQQGVLVVWFWLYDGPDILKSALIIIKMIDYLKGGGHIDDRPRLQEHHRWRGESSHQQIWKWKENEKPDFRNLVTPSRSLIGKCTNNWFEWKIQLKGFHWTKKASLFLYLPNLFPNLAPKGLFSDDCNF